MVSVMNILFSTTRQWNPGDEFILFGVLNLFHEVLEEFNPIIYNRNPDVCNGHPLFSNQFKSKVYKFIDKFPEGKLRERPLNILKLNQYDNSMKFLYNVPSIDLCVFAGTPEWNQKRIAPLYEYLNTYDIPCIYLGIGSSDRDSIDNIVHRCGNALKKSTLITVRDNYTLKLLEKFGAIFLTCPSILSSKKSKCVNTVNRIGLIYGTFKSVPANRISKDTYLFITEFYHLLAEKYNVEIVCHYIDEIFDAECKFQNIPIRYSYDSRAYFDIFNRYDLVIGPRIHGIGLAASMGIPGIAIKHDMRGDTAKGFNAVMIDPVKMDVKQSLQVVDESIQKIECFSKKILDLKEITLNSYIKLIKECVRCF